MADNNTVARPYARAAFEVAQENDALAELSESFAAARAVLSDGQVAAFLAVPSLTDKERLSFLQDLFGKVVGEGSVFAGGSEHGTNFVKLLLENDRVGVLPEIADHFEALKARVENTVDAVITSATALSAEQETAIASSKKRARWSTRLLLRPPLPIARQCNTSRLIPEPRWVSTSSITAKTR